MQWSSKTFDIFIDLEVREYDYVFGPYHFCSCAYAMRITWYHLGTAKRAGDGHLAAEKYQSDLIDPRLSITLLQRATAGEVRLGKGWRCAWRASRIDYI